jgi:hypothetical protein
MALVLDRDQIDNNEFGNCLPGVFPPVSNACFLKRGVSSLLDHGSARSGTVLGHFTIDDIGNAGPAIVLMDRDESIRCNQHFPGPQHHAIRTCKFTLQWHRAENINLLNADMLFRTLQCQFLGRFFSASGTTFCAR